MTRSSSVAPGIIPDISKEIIIGRSVRYHPSTARSQSLRFIGRWGLLLLLCSFLIPSVGGAQVRGGGGDTLKPVRPAPDSTVRVPSTGGSSGQYQGTPDTTAMQRLRETIRRDSALVRAYLDSIANTPLARMRRNLAMNPREWMTSDADRRRRDDEIKNSQSWDDIHQNIPRAGISVPLQAIGRALGIIEDVTPRIKYTLTRTDSITVKVYDLTAGIVRVIVNGVQSPGVYDFDWDMADNRGRRVAAGDYIAEVVVNRRLVLRKRIEVP